MLDGAGAEELELMGSAQLNDVVETYDIYLEGEREGGREGGGESVCMCESVCELTQPN